MKGRQKGDSAVPCPTRSNASQLQYIGDSFHTVPPTKARFRHRLARTLGELRSKHRTSCSRFLHGLLCGVSSQAPDIHDNLPPLARFGQPGKKRKLIHFHVTLTSTTFETNLLHDHFDMSMPPFLYQIRVSCNRQAISATSCRLSDPESHLDYQPRHFVHTTSAKHADGCLQ